MDMEEENRVTEEESKELSSEEYIEEEELSAEEAAEELPETGEHIAQAAPVASVPEAVPVKESRREKRAREKEEARLEKERAKQKAKEEKAAARAARKAERKYRNIPTVIILSLILALVIAALGYLGWEYIGARSTIDSLTADNTNLSAKLEDFGKTIEEKDAQIEEQLTEIENKNALISDGDAAVREISEKVTALEEQIKAVRSEAADLLDVIAHKEPLGVAYSGDFYADRAVVLVEDGESFPLNVTVMYGEKTTGIRYSFDESTSNIDSLSLSQEAITGSSGLISVKANKKNSGESGLAVLKFENEHSEDFFYVIVVIQ